MGVLGQPVELGAEPKGVIQLVPLGRFVYHNPAFNNGEPREFDITPEVIEQFIASKEPADVVVDYEHQTLGQGEAPASGWIKELIDGGERGLLGRVEWTERAKGLIAAKEYRYVSPTILKGVLSKTEPGKRIPYKLHSVALVNSPYIGNIEPVACKATKASMEERQMKKFKEWLASLGIKLDDNATEDQLVAACKQIVASIVEASGIPADTATLEGIKTGIAALKQQATGDSAKQIDKIREALGLKAEASVSEMEGTIAALKATHDNHDEMFKRLKRLEDDVNNKNAEEAVTAACSAGKVTPAQRDWALGYAKKDLASFQAFVAKAPVVVSPTSIAQGAKLAEGGAAVDETAIAVAKMFGNTAEDLKTYGQKAG